MLLIAQVFVEDIPSEDNPHGWQEQLVQIQREINRQLTQNLHNMEHGDIKRLHRFLDVLPRIHKLHFAEAAAQKKRRR